MNFVLIGSLCCARIMASRASGSGTPASSNITRPGFTTATQPSGLPLPEPMRVSAGFFVTGLSGKMLIHTLPPRRMCRVMATRAASIWRFVIQAGLQRHQAVVAEVDLRAALGHAAATAAMHLAPLHLLGCQHQASPPSRRAARAPRPSGTGDRLGRRPGGDGPVTSGAFGLRARRWRRSPRRRRGRRLHLLRRGVGARERALRVLLAAGDLVAVVDPDLHADLAERGARLRGAEVDLRAERVWLPLVRRTGATVVTHPSFVDAHGDRYLDDPELAPHDWLYRLASWVEAGVPSRSRATRRSDRPIRSARSGPRRAGGRPAAGSWAGRSHSPGTPRCAPSRPRPPPARAWPASATARSRPADPVPQSFSRTTRATRARFQRWTWWQR